MFSLPPSNQQQQTDTAPSLPLDRYAGTFHFDLYGQLVVRQNGEKLSVILGDFTPELSHWEDESFYVRSPTRLTYDWLLPFDVSNDGETTDVTIKHIGWDSDEQDHVFTHTQWTTTTRPQRITNQSRQKCVVHITAGNMANRWTTAPGETIE